MRIDIHIHFPDGVPGAAPDTATILAAIQGLENHMSQTDDALTALAADVAAEKTVEDSAIALLNGIPAVVAKALADAGVNDAASAAAVAAIDASIKANSATLSDAVTANTPAA
jgi:hypothetical protein